MFHFPSRASKWPMWCLTRHLHWKKLCKWIGPLLYLVQKSILFQQAFPVCIILFYCFMFNLVIYMIFYFIQNGFRSMNNLSLKSKIWVVKLKTTCNSLMQGKPEKMRIWGWKMDNLMQMDGSLSLNSNFVFPLICLMHILLLLFLFIISVQTKASPAHNTTKLKSLQRRRKIRKRRNSSIFTLSKWKNLKWSVSLFILLVFFGDAVKMIIESCYL